VTISEEQVYLWLKKYVRSNEGYLIGGQPPSGTDHLPVLEIRDPANADRGSRESFKPDLVFALGGHIFIVEIKPGFSKSDRAKQLSLLRSPQRIEMFWEELQRRKISSPIFGDVDSMRKSLDVAVALAFEGHAEPDEDLWLICGQEGAFVFWPPTRHALPTSAVGDMIGS